VESLLRRANIAMQAAKGSGRGRHAWFDTSMERELISRNMIEAGLREGIPLGQFVPYYEPQVDLDTNALLGFEVLARWEHPSRGVIAPDNFIPVAEECGLISELSIAVMRRAFSEARDWSPSLTLSVNISPAQLRDPWLAQKIVKLPRQPAGDRDHRKLAVPEPAARAIDRRQSEEPGHPARPRRFRHGLFVARTPARAAVRPDQDRPQLRHLDQQGSGVRRDRQRHLKARREPQPADHGGGHRGWRHPRPPARNGVSQGSGLAFRQADDGDGHAPDAGRTRPAAERARIGRARRRVQKRASDRLRKLSSSAVVSRPRAAFRWGKRPKRSICSA
jgi:hypothetical protein